MQLPATVAWTFGILMAGLAALGLRAWWTLGEGRRFQERLSSLPTEELHRFLSAPRGSLPGHPADVLYRLNALMEFERRGDPRLIPLYIRLLEDPHASVVSICREALEELTGEKLRDRENETLPSKAAWATWWEQNRGRYERT
jgi:HEAT repeat protein